MNRLKKTICAGIVLLAIGEFLGMRMPHEDAAAARSASHEFQFGLTRAIPGAARPQR
jgi:hypothetical protein